MNVTKLKTLAKAHVMANFMRGEDVHFGAYRLALEAVKSDFEDLEKAQAFANEVATEMVAAKYWNDRKN
jgi:hypothetical protein